MKKYPTKQSKKRVSSPSNTPKRSRRLLPGSFMMNVRSDDIAAESGPDSTLVQLDNCETSPSVTNDILLHDEKFRNRTGIRLVAFGRFERRFARLQWASQARPPVSWPTRDVRFANGGLPPNQDTNPLPADSCFPRIHCLTCRRREKDRAPGNHPQGDLSLVALLALSAPSQSQRHPHRF